MRNFIIFSLLFLGCKISLAQNHAMDDFVNSDNLTQASIGFLMRDLETGKTVASYQPKICRNPASVTKLITTATAMELLTDTFRFHTDLEMSGEIKDSVLYGNLYIRGGGDPSLESYNNPVKNQFYEKIIDTISSLGIKRIQGAIIGDPSIFREDGAPMNWLVEDVGSSYSPTPSGLSAHDNLLSFVITSDTTGFSLSKVSPHTRLFQPKFELTQNKKMEPGWRFTKTDFSWQPIIRGNLPMGICQYLKTELSEPAMLIADSIRNRLIANGIAVDSAATTTRWTPSDPIRTVIYSYRSAPLKDIIRLTNHKSINLYAENIFMILSRTKDSTATCTSWTSANVISKFWKSKGIDSNKIFQVDGSGMSMKNAISPQFMVEMLTYMYKESKYSKSFIATLPTAGRNGTVASFMKETKLEGKAHIKSGSMERVQNFAGYINANNKWYAFSIMVSNFTGARAAVKKQISTLLNALIVSDGQLIKQP